MPFGVIGPGIEVPVTDLSFDIGVPVDIEPPDIAPCDIDMPDILWCIIGEADIMPPIFFADAAHVYMPVPLPAIIVPLA